MDKTSQILQLLKQSSRSTRSLDQIFARITITGIARTKTLIWNSIIRAYANSPNPIQAIFAYNHFIVARSLYADSHTYSAILKACARFPWPPKTKEIHAHVVKRGFLDDVYIQNCFVYLYGAAFSQIVDARKLFDEMPRRDLTSWNSILTAYVSAAEHELLVRALILFREMVRGDVWGDEVTLAILLSGCKHGELRFGRIIHAYALKAGLVFFTKVGNAIMDIYATMCDLDATLRLFEEMGALGSSDIASDTIMINGYMQAGLVDHARDVFNSTCSRDIVLWNSMLNGYVKAKRGDEALDLFKQMETEAVNPDENTMVSVISACAALADLQSGRLLHRFIRRRGIREDDYVQTALVDMYAKCGSFDDSLITFLKMREKDVFAWTAVISGVAGHGNESLKKVLSMMQEAGVKPNEATLVAMLKACSDSGLVEEGLQLFTKMVEDQESEMKKEHLGCVVDLLSKAGMLSEAEELIKRAKVEDKSIVWKTLMGGCTSHGEVCIGERAAEELKRVSGERRGLSVLLSNFYAFGRRWSDVEEVRRMGRRLEGKKEPGTSCVRSP